MSKIIFSDYDGTLDTGEEDIIKNISAIKKFRDNGNLFVIATGRSYFDLKEKLNLYKIPFDYLIVNHGSVILDKNENVIYSCPIPKNISIEILNMLKNNINVEEVILFDTAGSVNLDIYNDFTKIMLKIKNEIFARDLSQKINNDWKKHVKSYIMQTSEDYLVEIVSIKTDKSKAIEKVLKDEKIIDSDVYTIGAGANDLEMILRYNGYGMKNSDEVIYTATNKICNTVAELIETLNL